MGAVVPESCPSHACQFNSLPFPVQHTLTFPHQHLPTWVHVVFSFTHFDHDLSSFSATSIAIIANAACTFIAFVSHQRHPASKMLYTWGPRELSGHRLNDRRISAKAFIDSLPTFRDDLKRDLGARALAIKRWNDQDNAISSHPIGRRLHNKTIALSLMFHEDKSGKPPPDGWRVELAGLGQTLAVLVAMQQQDEAGSRMVPITILEQATCRKDKPWNMDWWENDFLPEWCRLVNGDMSEPFKWVRGLASAAAIKEANNASRTCPAAVPTMRSSSNVNNLTPDRPAKRVKTSTVDVPSRQQSKIATTEDTDIPPMHSPSHRFSDDRPDHVPDYHALWLETKIESSQCQTELAEANLALYAANSALQKAQSREG